MKMYLKLDGTTILTHDYQSTAECDVELNNPPVNAGGHPCLINADGDYKYKYVNGALVELTSQEIKDHPRYIARKLAEVRQVRNMLLEDSDYVVLPDSGASENCKAAFVTYRQALRDITEGIDVEDFDFPVAPSYEKAE